MDLDSFIDPNTREPLTFRDDRLASGTTTYPIRLGIPRFVPSENYSQAFGLQWKSFRRTQLDSVTGTNITETRLRHALGRPLESLRGQKVLEAGSGAGRFTEILLKHGAELYSFDYSEAVDANAQNNFPHERLTLFQADVQAIPFTDNFFDLVLCLGVLQHTPSTRESLKELTRVLKPGGTLSCDHYKWHAGAFTSLYLLWWMAIRRMRPDLQFRVTEALTKFFYPLHWRFRENAVAQMLLRRVSPINFYFGRYDLPESVLYEWSRLDTHDRNTDHYKRHITKRQLVKLLQELGYREQHVEIGGTGYVARAIK